MEKTRSAPSTTATEKGDARETATLHSAAVFHALLRHERSRSDRDGSEFSLAVFDVSGIISDSRGMKQIVCGIREKMRSIDELGWLDARDLAVILPVTNLLGGQRFAGRVSGSLSLGLIPWTVYTYPAHWLPGGNGGSGREYHQPAWQREASARQEQQNKSADAYLGEKKDHVRALMGRAFCLRVPLWKRCMDIFGSLVLILVLSPLLFLLAIYVKCVSPGKVLFRQKRVGYQGKLFTFLKFRTMRENNDPSAHRDYLKELIRGGMPMEKLDVGADPRIIPGGKILRKTCLDELPQLFNVLRGEMSLVGPRPCIPYEAEEFKRWHTHRFDILPGMTGLWQVSGKNKLSFEQMIRFDIAYTNRMSPLLDMKILLLTMPTIIGLVIEASVKKLGLKKLTPAKEFLNKSSEKEILRDA